VIKKVCKVLDGPIAHGRIMITRPQRANLLGEAILQHETCYTDWSCSETLWDKILWVTGIVVRTLLAARVVRCDSSSCTVGEIGSEQISFTTHA